MFIEIRVNYLSAVEDIIFLFGYTLIFHFFPTTSTKLKQKKSATSQ